MNATPWYAGLTLHVDSDAILDYDLDLAKWLDDTTIDNVSVSAVGCTAALQTSDATSCTIRVSAVVSKAVVTVTVDTVDGQHDDFPIIFRKRRSA